MRDISDLGSSHEGEFDELFDIMSYEQCDPDICLYSNPND
jgi:hypothetical protein